MVWGLAVWKMDSRPKAADDQAAKRGCRGMRS